MAESGTGHGGGAWRSKGRAAMQFLCLVCLVATLPIYSPNIVTLNHFLVADTTAVYARTVIGFSLAGALAVCALSVRKARADRTQLAPGPRLMAAFATAYFVGCGGYVVLMALSVCGPAADVCAFVCAALAGTSLTPLCVHWASIAKALELRRLIAIVGLGLLAGALVNLALLHLPWPMLFVAHVAFLAVASFAPLVLRSPAKEPPTGQVEAPQLKSFSSVMGIPLAGIALSSYVIGVAPATVFAETVDTQAVGAIVAGALALPFAFIATKIPTNILVRQAISPAVCALCLAVCALPFLEAEVKMVVSYTMFSLVGVVALGTATAISNAHEFPRAFVFAALVGAYCLAAALGLATGFFLAEATEHHVYLVIVLATIYCATTVLASCATSLASCSSPAEQDRDDPALQVEAGRRKPTELDAETCAALIAERCGLTPRESEILAILARGHGSAYVADTLLISKNTVYTHVRNLYRKLGICCHEELVQLVDRERTANS